MVRGAWIVLLAAILTGCAANGPPTGNPSERVVQYPTQNFELAKREKLAALRARALEYYYARQFDNAAVVLREAALVDPADEEMAFLLKIVATKNFDQQCEEVSHISDGPMPLAHPRVQRDYD